MLAFASSNSMWAAISVGKPIFVVGKDEVDITFAAVNDTASSVRFASLRDKTALVINGKEVKNSEFIFTNGIHPVAEFLPPGKTYAFLYRLTEYFRKPGIYEVVWRGKGFQTMPLVFRVVEAQQ